MAISQATMMDWFSRWPGKRAQDGAAHADHSVFINAMLVQNDNQNAVFAYGCVDWLTENGKRKHVLFINEGHLQSRFDTPLKLGSDTSLRLRRYWSVCSTR